LRLVMTTCFSGGFGELAFRRADVNGGLPRAARCGLFAAPWDLESTGCDPDPDRRLHDGYATFFFPALRGKDRSGAPLPAPAVDFDHDGRVSLLEAHTRVRIAAQTADVPTTTSERWLRAVAPKDGPAVAVELPEERAVITALAERLGIRSPLTDARTALDEAVRADDVVRDRVSAAQRREDEAWHALASALLARWPVLDDPWHPEFAALWSRDRAAIEAHARTSPRWRRYDLARAATDAAQQERDRTRTRSAWHERLVRAVETVAYAERLSVRHDEDWLYWRQLLRCERHVPRLADPGEPALGAVRSAR